LLHFHLPIRQDEQKMGQSAEQSMKRKVPEKGTLYQ